ncbi:MAG: 50S ribosomal protein L3 [Firmicutes bacterium]|nr:50S ribosomal protein L3 [Bacillota bacterium]
MKKAIIGRKLGMTQIFDNAGNVIPVTVVEAGPCLVTFKKTNENDGYEAVQLGFGEIKASKVTKPMKGHFDKNDVAPKRVLKEFRLDDISALNIGDVVKADTFAEGEAVDVTGRSKGKGYAGVIKRHGFHRLKMSHGTGPVARHGGSMGECSTPSRVYKGKKMAGHMGTEKVTVQNLAVVKVDVENNILAIKGAIPGPKGGYVFIADSVKA